MERDDLVWLSGLLEGEGCFDFRPQSNGAHLRGVPRIRLIMTDEDVVARVAGLWDRKYHKNRPRTESRQPSFETQIGGRPVAEMMTALLPLMGRRRSERIREVLAAYGD